VIKVTIKTVEMTFEELKEHNTLCPGETIRFNPDGIITMTFEGGLQKQ
jgi:hypothetical protein